MEEQLGIGQALRLFRTMRGMQGQDLAKATGIDQSMLSRVEASKRAPSLDALESICQALRVPVWSLMSVSEATPDDCIEALVKTVTESHIRRGFE